MAEKGARAKFEDIAFRMYAEGKTLTEIEAALGVSRQSLSEWKSRTKAPDQELDEWDKAREQKRSTGRRLEFLLDRELRFAEELHAGGVDSATWDSISKLGALVQRFQASEREALLKSQVYKSGVFLDFMRDLIQFFVTNDPAGVSLIENHFDDLIVWGREKYGTA